ncbi:WD repeat-containing protein 53 isoform X2 [Tachysurus vachellii]|nr:WD repeat-containing protein 53 isoform X2 [Tachysurus vachellii]XP_060730553.1 WD repeat-containing protein 53 isoform X2 [Tachysurus vachellii]XP_060730562.1 WD repeat-containing protein 53 isoform X2 [Tachysurus vachellii]XP_060730570.1 WD repeat-containing protein 53 isoform X2 [Tachysurus vachellii]XP_060730579.1 WD repeat-containing protein 53 isoform X2 [Tachysurus vachellii]XP_060730584.1 WD repeat-containing protein 53 isoform X2 [Tachysurus vachellii]XP_060730593.1 WD repeat-cont
MAQHWAGGHTAPVLCVGAAGGGDGFLASGAEGGEVTVWTQEGTPLSQLRLTSRDDVTCTVFSNAAPGLLYVSHGETVSILDPRCLKKPAEELKDVGEDEINSLSVSETGASLALADDSGAVRVVDLQTCKVSRTLRKHTNICSSVTFRPQRPQSLVSAGLDMQLMLWNLQKARPVWTYSLQEATEEEERSHQQAGQLFNPPLAHCVSVAACGNILACAAEDGRVHLTRVGAGSRLEQQGAIKAHSQGASQAHFLNFMPHPYWLATGGNDGVVALWDISEEPVVAGEVKAKAQRRKPKNKTSKQATHEAQEGKRSEEEITEEARSIDPSQTKLASKLKLAHGEKVNWVCPALLKGQPSLLVADQSSSLSVYSLSGL